MPSTTLLTCLFHQQIETSLRSTEKSGPSDAEIARLNAEKRLFGGQRERIVAEMQRYATMKDPRLRLVVFHKEEDQTLSTNFVFIVL